MATHHTFSSSGAIDRRREYKHQRLNRRGSRVGYHGTAALGIIEQTAEMTALGSTGKKARRNMKKGDEEEWEHTDSDSDKENTPRKARVTVLYCPFYPGAHKIEGGGDPRVCDVRWAWGGAGLAVCCSRVPKRWWRLRAFRAACRCVVCVCVFH